MELLLDWIQNGMNGKNVRTLIVLSNKGLRQYMTLFKGKSCLWNESYRENITIEIKDHITR